MDLITTSESDTDICKSVNSGFDSCTAPQRFAPPPGLEAPPGLNTQAPVFVPHVAAAAAGKAGLNKTADAHDHSLLALQEAVSKLTPQQAAGVRALLAAKADADRNTKATRMGLKLDLLVPPATHDVSDFVPPPGLLHPVANARQQASASGFAQPSTPFSAHQASASMGQQDRLPQKKPVADGEVGSLRSNLADLAQVDSDLVLMVRKINRLGCDSAAAMESYFSKFGTIDRCMVNHSRSRPTPGGPARLRPATVGFLVMSDPEAVKSALNFNGGEHLVRGVTINVAPFKSHPIDA